MIRAKVSGDRFEAGGRLSFRLERTVRVPSDGKVYPLPPSLGAFPVYDLPGDRGWMVPLYQFEAVWISFQAALWKPNAVQVASGGVNAITGAPYPSPLSGDPQNYIVCPLQPWLDGFKTGEGIVSQFVAAPLGSGLTVEEQITDTAAKGGLTVRVFEPKPGIFPERAPRRLSFHTRFSLESTDLGLAAGGAIEQKVYPDPDGVHVWDERNSAEFRIRIVNSTAFREITGEAPPPSPVSAEDYVRWGLPWFRIYDEELADLRAAPAMKRVKPL